jgi:hypothetical protein
MARLIQIGSTFRPDDLLCGIGFCAGLLAFGSPHAYWIVGRFSALTERHGPRGFNLNLVPRACESSCDSARRGRQLACSLLGSPRVHSSLSLPRSPGARWLSPSPYASPIPSLGRPRDVAPPGRHGRARHAIQTDTRPGRVPLRCAARRARFIRRKPIYTKNAPDSRLPNVCRNFYL